MQLLIIGTGYVGLVTGACFAEMGHHVTCLDIDQEKIDQLKNGNVPIFEPGLTELVLRNQAAGRLIFTTDYAEAVNSSSVCFIAVPTPSAADGSCEISYILQAASEVARQMQEDKVIVTKSTAPPGTAHAVKRCIREILDKRGVDLNFDLVSNPEFLKEGCAVSDCMKPDRIILGVENSHAEKVMREIYSSFTWNHDRFISMDLLSAEMTKYAANAMLATRISFMNELSRLCESIGANIHSVRVGIGSDVRIGYQFLYAGIGYGGSCFPKDLRALIASGQKAGCEMSLVQAVEEINERQKMLLGSKILSYFATQGGVKNKTIALWGLSFKPDTDDIREAPSLVLIQQLSEAGAKLRLYDPIAMSAMKKAVKDQSNITWCSDEYQAAEGADAIALLTEWKQFRVVNFEQLLTKMRGKGFFDGRNQYKSQEMLERGFDYFGIGIPQPTTQEACSLALTH
ncbi:MAG: UDP-glucose/GDP-mannose dehydrogenase family protein [Chlamydiales bacterium]|nr:UDP-glucose/GDP-mannose dehydrogenase family protein [Chlamydiales bacterium]